MAQTYCTEQSCRVNVANRALCIICAYIAAGLALVGPFVNSAGQQISSALILANIQMSFTSVVILGVWLLSGIVASCERHTHVLLCVLSSLGLPGLLLAVLTLGKA